MLKVPAASAAPVPPAQTSAWARPSATARAAITIEASGVVRAARRVLGLGDRDRRVDHLTPCWDLAQLGRRAEQEHARALGGGDRGARSHLGGAEVGAVAVDRDHRLLWILRNGR